MNLKESITYTSSLPSHLMKVQRYIDTHLTTLIMTQYVPHSEAHMAEVKNTIVIRNPFSTGNISGKDLIHQDLQATR